MNLINQSYDIMLIPSDRPPQVVHKTEEGEPLNKQQLQVQEEFFQRAAGCGLDGPPTTSIHPIWLMNLAKENHD